MEIAKFVVGPIQANCFLCWHAETTRAVIIDPGAEAERLLGEITSRGLELQAVILTHFHFDHVGAADDLRQATGATIAIHADDAAFLANQPPAFRMFAGDLPAIVADTILHDGDTITLGTEFLEVIATPGHSPGGICLLNAQSGDLFSGDTLFRRSIGRTDFPGCDSKALLASIRTRLLGLPPGTRVHPGHGADTTIGEEARLNPFLR